MRGNTKKIKCMLMIGGGNKNETTTCNIETGRNGAALRLGCMVRASAWQWHHAGTLGSRQRCDLVHPLGNQECHYYC